MILYKYNVCFCMYDNWIFKTRRSVVFFKHIHKRPWNRLRGTATNRRTWWDDKQKSMQRESRWNERLRGHNRGRMKDSPKIDVQPLHTSLPSNYWIHSVLFSHLVHSVGVLFMGMCLFFHTQGKCRWSGIQEKIKEKKKTKGKFPRESSQIKRINIKAEKM